MKQLKEIIEQVVAGDSGGNPENIAAGTNTGAIVSNVAPKKKENEDEENS